MSGQPSLLLIHDDSDLLDLLTRYFESRGFAVAIAATVFSAMTQLQSRREFDVIIAGWDVGRGVGAEVYRWVLKHRFHLRGQFIFLAREPPDDFDALVQGRCLLLRPTDVEDIVRAGEAAALRSRRLRELSEDDLAWMDIDRPTLLVVDDDAMLLMTMVHLLGDVGFSVTPAESGNAAIALLERADFDVILSDWFMSDGSGADLHAWLVDHRPDLAERLIFLSGAWPEDLARQAPGRTLVPKGQDSPVLVRLLMETARAAKRAG
jgi:CheY-like chemotaxis protein